MSTAEDSKIVEYRYNKLNVFRYEVNGLNNLNGEEIINNISAKLKYGEPLTGRDIILLSLVPLSKKGKNIIEYIYFEKFNFISKRFVFWYSMVNNR